MITSNKIAEQLSLVREKSPLVHNITNYVVMNNTANALLSIGASPVMAHAIEEVESMVGIASALVINIGTLSSHWIEGMLAAGKKAKELKKPIIFDPVGVGATDFRNDVAMQIMQECKPNIIRGNASEIMALANINIRTKGVDSTMSSANALESAILIAKENKAVVVISGEIDYITNGETTYSIANGSHLMPKVTGMGCTASAICGAFAGVTGDYLLAATSAMAVMGISGQIAEKNSKGNGSMQVNFLDSLYNIDKQDVIGNLKLKNE